MRKATRDYSGYRIVTHQINNSKWSFALFDPNKTRCYCGWCDNKDFYSTEEEALDAAVLKINLCIDKDGIKFK